MEYAEYAKKLTVGTLEKMKKPLEDSKAKKGFYEFYPEKKSTTIQS
ncbi:MAG: hypothetical protein H3Z53_12275 [archaeon]|nr:hypothetical protein [archaeon]MCP8315125.1 hypothetical protein [archaeon]MCP8320032.1 hypothetical protein [archaeon]